MNITQVKFAMRTLDWLQFLPHINTICGQSRRGGVETSNSRRRSNTIFGRVAVTHVQGSPKGGGALGLLRVSNTRLSSVPPMKWEVLMSRVASLVIGVCLFATTATPSEAQSLGDLLGDAISDAASKPKRNKIRELCNSQPYRDYFVTVAIGYVTPRRDVSEFSSLQTANGGQVAFSELDPVLNELFNQVQVPTWATTNVIIGQPDNGMNTAMCEIRYLLGVSGSYEGYFKSGFQGVTYMHLQQEGGAWKVRNFTDSSSDQVSVSTSVVPVLNQFFEPGLSKIFTERQEAKRIAQEVEDRQHQRAMAEADAAYQASPAGRAERARLAARNAALSEEYRKRGNACLNSGGTWGYLANGYGNKPTLYQLTPGELPTNSYYHDKVVCYHL